MWTLVLYFTLFSSIPIGPQPPAIIYDQLHIDVGSLEVCRLIGKNLSGRKWIYISIGDKKYQLLVNNYTCSRKEIN